MTLLDAYALVAVLTRGPAAVEVRSLVRSEDVSMPTANLAEVLDIAQRVKGMPRELAWAGVEPFVDGVVETIPLTVAIARVAAEIRAQHHHGQRRALSLADCVLLASGRRGDRVATADPDVLAVAPLVGLEPVALPPER